MGFSPCLLLPGKGKSPGAKSPDLCWAGTARLKSCPNTRIPRDRQTLLPAGAAIQSITAARTGKLAGSADFGSIHLLGNVELKAQDAGLGLEFVHLSKAAAAGTELPGLKGPFPECRWPSLRNEIKSIPMSETTANCIYINVRRGTRQTLGRLW